MNTRGNAAEKFRKHGIIENFRLIYPLKPLKKDLIIFLSELFALAKVSDGIKPDFMLGPSFVLEIRMPFLTRGSLCLPMPTFPFMFLLISLLSEILILC